MNKNFYSWIILFFFFTAGAVAQDKVIITGIVSDSAGAGMERVSVSLVDAGNRGYLFTMTGKEGAFALRAPDSLFRQPLFIKFSAIGYGIEKVPVAARSANLAVTLQRKSISLPPVVVQSDNRGVRIGSDTTHFKTGDFKEPEDRVIADVIRRIPGMTVSENGQIKFNGKPISNVYIDGENILDGRYRMATGNLPATLVDEVQVIDRDQPVKALNGYVASANTALNLKLDDKAKLVTLTTADAAAGNKGGEVNAFNIVLDKKTKALTELKANNTGIENGNGTGFSVSNGASPVEWGAFHTYLSDMAASLPSVAEKYYLRNKDVIAGTNLFQKWKPDLSVRFAMNAEWKRRTYSYQYLQQYFLPSDTITFSEIQDKQHTEKLWKPRFDIELNSRRQYLKTVTELTLPRFSGQGWLITNGDPVRQLLDRDGSSIGNETTIVGTAGKNKVYQYNSLVQYYETGESLSLEPGTMPELINAGNPYAALYQPAQNRNTLVSQRLLLRGKVKHAAFSAGGGIAYKREGLVSQLSYREENHSFFHPVQGNYANDAVLNNFKVYGSAEVILTRQKDYLVIGITSGYNLNRMTSRLTGTRFSKNIAENNPYLNLRKQLGRYGELVGGFKSTLRLGTMEDMYTGNLLVNYRQVVANAVPLPVSRETGGTLSFFYKKPLQMLFYNIILSWSGTSSNYTPAYVLTDGAATLVSSGRKNYQSFYNASGSLSRYLFDLKTDLRLSGSAQLLKGRNVLNDELVPYSLAKYSVGLGWNIKLAKKLHVSGSVDEGWQALRNKTQYGAGSNARTGYQNTEKIGLQLKYVPVENIILTPSFTAYAFRRSSGDNRASFFDFSIIYRPGWTNGEFQLSGMNIGGRSLYRDGTVLVNSVAYASVPLVRNRILVRYLFSF
ncbi:MAG: carboxypeptidase-like regulatory domain-containing protein [Chitinophagaceae bacterium]